MAKKLRVLISAYACEPNKGSEPEVGWQWALQMAKYHEVTVLTRENNRAGIENELALLRGKIPLPEFVYHDRGRLWLKLKKRFGLTRPYYVAWQNSARKLVNALQQQNKFDLLHHVTFAGFRYPTVIWNQGSPCVWGPIGGAESVPAPLLPWGHPSSLIAEAVRNLNNLVQISRFYLLPKRAKKTTLILVSTQEMGSVFSNLGFKTQLMPTIGLHLEPMPRRRISAAGEPLKILFVGNIITLKGIDLAIEALKKSKSTAVFTVVGSGNYTHSLKQLTKKLGLERQVIFPGRMARAETLKLYPNYDLFMFPSLHDTGGYAVIEAMACGLPVICLDCGGPRVAVGDDSGMRIPLGSRGAVIDGLAGAIKKYDGDRSRLATDGMAARERVEQHYNWELKGRQLDAVYQQAVETVRI